MKILLLFLPCLLHSTSALSVKSQLPSFSWLSGTDPLLKIRFPDGGHDVIRFHETERLQGEDEDCIMSGEFEQEPDVSVTLTGGCVNSKDFEMTIVGSERLQHATFKITNGKAKPTGHPTNRGFDESDDVVGFPRPIFRNQQLPSTLREALPYEAWLTLELHADLAFYREFPTCIMCQTAMCHIVAHAQTWFKSPSLRPKISLQPLFPSIWKYNRTITSDLIAELGIASKFVDFRRNRNLPEGKYFATQDRVAVFFGMRPEFQNLKGIAFSNSLCQKKLKNNVTAIVEHWRYLAESGAILAHELAHTLYVDHDIDDTTKLYRKDKNGRSCYTTGSLMDNQASITTWSTCSMQSLQNAFEKGWLNCLARSFDDES